MHTDLAAAGLVGGPLGADLDRRGPRPQRAGWSRRDRAGPRPGDEAGRLKGPVESGDTSRILSSFGRCIMGERGVWDAAKSAIEGGVDSAVERGIGDALRE